MYRMIAAIYSPFVQLQLHNPSNLLAQTSHLHLMQA